MAYVFVDRDASCCDALLAVRIPLFAIHAEDDPVGSPFLRLTRARIKGMKVAVQEAIPYQEIQQNPFTVLCTTRLGGHLGWFENGAGRWFAKPVSELFPFHW